MTYKIIVKGFDIKLNQLINGRMYDYRSKKYRNSVKNKGDMICQKAIRQYLKGVHISNPILCHYYFFVKDRKSDRDGILSAFLKCFLDALQKENVIDNDGWNYVLTPQIERMEVDKENPRIVVVIEEIVKEK